MNLNIGNHGIKISPFYVKFWPEVTRCLATLFRCSALSIPYVLPNLSSGKVPNMATSASPQHGDRRQDFLARYLATRYQLSYKASFLSEISEFPISWTSVFTWRPWTRQQVLHRRTFAISSWWWCWLLQPQTNRPTHTCKSKRKPRAWSS